MLVTQSGRAVELSMTTSHVRPRSDSKSPLRSPTSSSTPSNIPGRLPRLKIVTSRPWASADRTW